MKAAVSPWDSSLVPVDVFRSPLGRAFSLLEEIRNHVHSDRYSAPRLDRKGSEVRPLDNPPQRSPSSPLAVLGPAVWSLCASR